MGRIIRTTAVIFDRHTIGKIYGEEIGVIVGYGGVSKEGWMGRSGVVGGLGIYLDH